MPFLILILLMLMSPGEVAGQANYQEVYTSPTGEKKIIVLVESDIADGVLGTSEFLNWRRDLETENFKVKVTRSAFTTGQALKAYIVSNYNSTFNVEGVILIGDFPNVSYEGVYWGSHEIFPIDLFFTDMDGVWQDTDFNGVYDVHSGNRSPEIWLGRIKTGNLDHDLSRDEIGKIRFYLNKSHLYRTNQLKMEKKALVYDNAFLVNYNRGLNSVYEKVEVAYLNGQTSAVDYKKRLLSNYEWVYIIVHSTPNYHLFMNSGGDNIVNDKDIIKNNPTTMFYYLAACSNVNYTWKNSMGGQYIYNRQHGLVAIGSTKLMGEISPNVFFYYLNEKKQNGDKRNIGEAFKEWFQRQNINNNMVEGAIYGMTIIGDPTLTMFISLTPTFTPTPTPIPISFRKGWNYLFSTSSVNNFPQNCFAYSYKDYFWKDENETTKAVPLKTFYSLSCK